VVDIGGIFVPVCQRVNRAEGLAGVVTGGFEVGKRPPATESSLASACEMLTAA
jgi:hypothetical protein